MDIKICDFGQNAKKVVLIGKLNSVSAQTIELPLAKLAASKTNIVVDMTGVDFIASVGIQQLILAAKATLRASHKLVLLDPSPLITDVLAIARLEQYLPIVRSDEEARAAFAAGAT